MLEDEHKNIAMNFCPQDNISAVWFVIDKCFHF